MGIIISSKTCKREARKCLKGNWGTAVLSTLIMLLIIFLFEISVQVPPFLGTTDPQQLDSFYFPILVFIIFALLFVPLYWGFRTLFLNAARGEKINCGSLFDGFRDYGRVFFTMFLKGLYIMLWSLLLLVPGVIKYYSYAMTEFVLKDDDEIGSDGAIERSMELMRGHKMSLFLLDLSMIGWLMLRFVTFGLADLWVLPYRNTAHARFYERLLEEEASEPVL